MVEGRARRAAPAASILVVDDEVLIRDTLAEYLGQEGYAVAACATGEEALALAARQRFDVALCDVQLPGMDGLQLLERLHRISPETFVLLITAYATVENAVEAFQHGAHDYLMKPILLDEVFGKVRRLMAHRALHLENQWLRRELNRAHDPGQIVGASPAMQQVFAVARKVAPTRSTVLITGESGTGKELIARAVFKWGPERPAPSRFIAVNCAAIPHDLLENQLFGHRKGAFTGADRDQAGVFVHAGSGVVFLDEIAELSPAVQAKLLRAIEQKEILPVGADEPVRSGSAGAGRHQQGPQAGGRSRPIPRGPLLPAGGGDDSPAASARAARGHSRSGDAPAEPARADAGQAPPRRDARGDAALAGVPLERQRPRAGQRAAACGDFGRRLADRAGRSAAGPGAGGGRPALVDDLGEAVRRFEKQHIERILRQISDKREAARRLGVGLSSLYRRISELGIQTQTG